MTARNRLLPADWPRNPWPTRFRTVRASDPALLPDGLRLFTINSPALGGRGELALFVPPAAADRVDVPIVVLLHGVYGSFWNWAFNGAAHLTAAALTDSGEIDPMVLVMPSDGMAGEGTGYLGRPVNAERWVMGDVLDAVIEAVPATSSRSPVMLGGLSMGGYGALRLGALYPDRVAAVSALSAVPSLDVLSEFLAAPLRRDDVAGLVELLVAAGSTRPTLRLECGSDDPLIAVNRELHAALDGAGVAHEYVEGPGGHDWQFWRRRLPATLRAFDATARSLVVANRPSTPGASRCSCSTPPTMASSPSTLAGREP